MMKFLSLEQISMENMIASTRFEFHRFMSYFLQQRRQSSLPHVLTILENPLILKICDEFCPDVQAPPTLLFESETLHLQLNVVACSLSTAVSFLRASPMFSAVLVILLLWVVARL